MKKSKLFTALLAILLASAVFAQPMQAAELSTIIVNGTGSVSLAPDIATVSLGVSTQHEQPQHALEENNVLTATIIETLLDLGVDEDDIRTEHFWIDAVFDFDWITITGYRVTNGISVTIRDIDQVGDILGAAVAAGANVSHGISFGTSDSTQAHEQALVLAIQDALRKANILADALDAEILGRISVTEIGGMHAPTAWRSTGGFASEMMDAMAFSSVPIEAGNLTVTANVQIVFSVTP